MGWLHYLMKDADSARFYLLSHTTELLHELGPAAKGEEESTISEQSKASQSDSDDSSMDVT